MQNPLFPWLPRKTQPSCILCHTSTSSSSSNSRNDNYRQVHGDVPSHDAVWRVASDLYGEDFTDIVYEKVVGEGIAKITINMRNAFRPHTVKELIMPGMIAPLGSSFSPAREPRHFVVVVTRP